MNRLLLMLFPCLMFGQAPDITWQNLIGGSANDGLNDILKTSDGGYLLTGSSISPISGNKTFAPFGGGPSAGSDIWLVRLDQNRNILWQAQYGGAGSLENSIIDSGVTTLPLNDGYFVTGSSNTPLSGNKTEYCRGGYDYWLIRTDQSGNPLWQKAYGGSGDDVLAGFVTTGDGNYVLAGSSNSYLSNEKSENTRGSWDGWIIKIDLAGNIIWQRTIGGSDDDRLSSVKATHDGGVIVCMASKSPVSGEKSEASFGSYDYWVVKLNNDGVIEWQKTIGGDNLDSAYDIIPTGDNGYLICGVSYSSISGLKTEPSYGGGDFWVLKLNDQGNVLWQKSLGGNNWDYPETLLEIPSGGFLVGGNTLSGISGNKTVDNFVSASDNFDTWLVRLSDMGDILWQKDIGGSNGDFGFKMFYDEDGGFVLGGSTNSSNSGSIDQLSHGDFDYWLLKLNPEELSTGEHENMPLAVWPNPTTNVVNIRFPDFQEKVSVSVYDALGRLVSDGKYEDVSAINGLALGNAAGLYLVKVETAGGVQSFKIVKN